MQELLQMLMKSVMANGLKLDLSQMDLPALLSKVSNVDSLKGEIMHQLGSKFDLQHDVVKSVMGGVDLSKVDLGALKNFDLSKLDMGSFMGAADMAKSVLGDKMPDLGGLAGAAGMASMAGAVMGGKMPDLGGLGGMLDGAKDMMGGISNPFDTAKAAGQTLVDVPGEVANATVEGVVDMGDVVVDGATDLNLNSDEMASNTLDASAETMGNTVEGAVDMGEVAIDGAADLTSENVEIASNSLDATTDAMGNMAEGAVDMGEVAIDGAADLGSGAVEMASQTLDSSTNAVANAWDSVSDATSNVAEGSVEAVSNVASNTVNAGGDMIDTAKDMFNQAVSHQDEVKSAATQGMGILDTIKNFFNK